MKKLISHLLQGVLYVAPIGITVYILYSVFVLIDGTLLKLLLKFYDIKIPGLGFLTLVLLLIIIGIVGNTIIARPLQLIFKKSINKVPLLKFMYSSLNDLFSAFVGKEKKFNQPVLVKINTSSDIEKLGFITRENISFLDQQDKVAVYFPHSYNFSGELFIVPRKNIKPVKESSSEVMKFIVSAGLTGVDPQSKTN